MARFQIRTIEGFMRCQHAVLENYKAGEIDRTMPTTKELKSALKKWRGRICVEFKTEGRPLTVQIVKFDFFDELKKWKDDEPVPVWISLINYRTGLLVLSPL